jgi:ribosomal protein L31
MEFEQCWKLAVLDTSDNTEKKFLIKTTGYEKERLIEILLDVHPEYDKIRVEDISEEWRSGEKI